MNEYGKDNGKVLDLRCGPGLYTTELSKKGYQVSGVDFSENSINYAKEQADKNYLNLDFENEFDLIIMIFCDF